MEFMNQESVHRPDSIPTEVCEGMSTLKLGPSLPAQVDGLTLA